MKLIISPVHMCALVCACEWNKTKQRKKKERKKPWRWIRIEHSYPRQLLRLPHRPKYKEWKKSPTQTYATRQCEWVWEYVPMKYWIWILRGGWRWNWRQKFCQAEKWVKSDSSLCKRVNDVNGIAVRVCDSTPKHGDNDNNNNNDDNDENTFCVSDVAKIELITVVLWLSSQIENLLSNLSIYVVYKTHIIFIVSGERWH